MTGLLIAVASTLAGIVCGVGLVLLTARTARFVYYRRECPSRPLGRTWRMSRR